MDTKTKRKWDAASRTLDFFAFAEERRLGPYKRRLFEHVRSAIGPLGILMDLMTPITTRFGPALNRDTVGNVQKAGFHLRRVENVYLDVVKIIEAAKESPLQP